MSLGSADEGLGGWGLGAARLGSPGSESTSTTSCFQCTQVCRWGGDVVPTFTTASLMVHPLWCIPHGASLMVHPLWCATCSQVQGGGEQKHRASRDPLGGIAEEMREEVAVLCLDEFMVIDVAEAAILNRLFSFLFAKGLVPPPPPPPPPPPLPLYLPPPLLPNADSLHSGVYRCWYPHPIELLTRSIRGNYSATSSFPLSPCSRCTLQAHTHQ